MIGRVYMIIRFEPLNIVFHHLLLSMNLILFDICHLTIRLFLKTRMIPKSLINQTYRRFPMFPSYHLYQMFLNCRSCLRFQFHHLILMFHSSQNYHLCLRFPLPRLILMFLSYHLCLKNHYCQMFLTNHPHPVLHLN